MMPPERSTELHELLERFCLDELSAEEQQRLDTLVLADNEARRVYVRYVHMHVCLRRAYENAGQAPAPRFDPLAPPSLQSDQLPLQASTVPHQRRFALRRWFGLIAASVVLALSVGWVAWHDHSPTHVATLTHAVGCRWETAKPPQPGDKLAAGRLELANGMAEIQFVGGAVALVEAPAVLELVSASRGFLHAGRVVLRIPEHTSGFVLETQRAVLLDQGTEFGVGVGDGGDMFVQVFDGVVVADLKDQPAGTKESQRLTAGQTMQFDVPAGSKPRELTTVPERFVRRFPPPSERGADQLVPYNKRRFDRVHIVPAPGQVRIDGDLTDWDRSGTFYVACEEPYTRDYYVEGSMMYDRNNLYISAHVGDPAPMCSIIDPKTDPTLGWKAGGVQVRLATDRSMTWPLNGQWGGVTGYKAHSDDRSNHLAHLTMWYHQPSGQPCLHLAFGFDFHGNQVNPPGFQGAFRKDADGRGYVLEYAIPWAVLHVGDNPPRGGDELGACWNVHWSDEEGRLWKGYWVDILNPQEKGFTYQRAATWGRAIYHRTGRLPAGTVVPR